MSASYGLIYRADYSTTTNFTGRIEIFKKDYTGDFMPLELSAEPVVQNYETDEQAPAIKGCSLTATFNNTGVTPIENFYSEDDDGFKVVHYIDSVITFIGFIVQDDCQEPMVDYRHEVSLSANDNLGLLKDVSLSNVPPISDVNHYPAAVQLSFVSPIPACYIILYYTDFIPQVGVPFTIGGHIDPIANATFTPLVVSHLGDSGWVVEVDSSSFSADTVAWPSRIAGFATYNLRNLNTLLNIIYICLYNTGIRINTYVYVNIWEDSQDNTRSFLEQTYIDPRVFLKSDEYINCWDVLTYILERFKLTLFQCQGRWNITRVDEFRFGNPNAFTYNDSMVFFGTTNFSNTLNFGFEQDHYPETAPDKSVVRPYKFVKETFNYVQPELLINNADLQDLGTFDHQDIAGGFTYDYYDFPVLSKWVHFFPGSALIDVSRIVVKTEIATGFEADRYIYQPKTNAGGIGVDHFANVQFNDIQVSAQDVMEFSLRIKAAGSTGGDNVIWRCGFILAQDEGSYWALQNGSGPLQWNQFFVPPDSVAPILAETAVLAANAEDYYDYILSNHDNGDPKQVPPFPVDGVLRIRVYGSNDTNASQAQVDAIWKDLKLTIKQFVNESSTIIGHTHTDTQDKVIKNTSDTVLQIDDSQRSTIAGTLFKVQPLNLVWLRTSQWYTAQDGTRRRLGDIITYQQLFQYRIPRTKIEGKWYILDDVMMLAVVHYFADFDKRFTFGTLTIYFRNNYLEATLYEIPYGETDAELTRDYVFKYLYQNK
jgi:hypothetical protein